MRTLQTTEICKSYRGRKVVDSPLAELTQGGRSLEQVFAQHTARDLVLPAASA